MRNYYFVVPSLPPLSVRERPEITFEEFMTRLEISLSKSDLEKTKVLRRFVDIFNIRALLIEETVDPRGNLNEKELDEALLVHAVLPDYVFEFLGQFEKVADKIRNFPGLLAQFFNSEIPKCKGFLRNYLSFERECRLVLVGLRAKQLGRDVARELQFEDPTDPLVAQILAQKDSDSYDPPSEYADLKELIASCYADPWLENKAFAEYRFKKIGEIAEGKLFTIEQILCYMAQLMIIENIIELDEERGNMILDTFKSG
ncbi:MAG: DUF2764 family protein [Verrucomicrobia bacterium]|nr:DUF2764 family protein [Verrucomicrobiota bacterium]